MTERLLDPAESLDAPHLLDVEVAQILRRFVRRGELAPDRAREALDDRSRSPGDADRFGAEWRRSGGHRQGGRSAAEAGMIGGCLQARGEDSMTELLERAFSEASGLPEEDQNSFANWILAELASEQRWARTFAQSGDKLARLAAEALREHAEGSTQELDPDEL